MSPRSRTSLVSCGLFAGSMLVLISVNIIIKNDRSSIFSYDSDEREYYRMAGRLLEGRDHFSPRRSIGHVLILAGLRAGVGERMLPLRLAIIAIFSLTAPLTYLLARRELGSERPALLAGLGVTLWPPFVSYGASLYSETTALPLFLGFLLALPGAEGSRRLRVGRCLGAGVLLGLCMHVRPMYLIFSPIAALIVYLRSPRGVLGMVAAVSLAAGCLLIVLPWSAYASLRHRSFILLADTGGETLAGGLNPRLLELDREGSSTFVSRAGRSTWVGPGKWLVAADTGYLSPEEVNLPYIEVGKLLQRRAISWAAGHPREAAYIILRKLSYMWGLYPFWNGVSQTLLGNVPTLGLLALGAASAFVFRRHLVATAPLWCLPVFVSLVAVMSWGSWRFRQPGDVGLLVLASALPWAPEVKRALEARSARGPASGGEISPVGPGIG